MAHKNGGWARIATILVLAAISCGGGTCGGGGCAGCGPAGYDFPDDDPNRPDAIVQDDAVRVRITQDFLDFVRPRLPDLIRSQLGSGQGFRVDSNNVLHVALPDQDLFNIGVAEARMRNAEALIWLDDLDTRLDIEFVAPNFVQLTMRNLRLGVELDLKEDVAGTTSSCPIIGDLAGGHAAEITIIGQIDPGVGPRPDYPLDIQVNLTSVALKSLDLQVGDYCSESECQDCLVEVFGNCIDPGGRCAECHVFCGGLTNGLLSLSTALIDLIRPLLNRILTPVVEGLLGNALNNLNGSSAKLEQQIDLAALSGIPALGRANPLGVFAAPTASARFPVVDRGTGTGMEITINGGAEAEIADCIGDLEDFIPTAGPVPEPPATDRRNRPYHIFTTLSQSFLNQIFYALHRGGTLCLKLSSNDIRELTGGSFSLNASLLSILASDLTLVAQDRAPVILELKPRKQPLLELGTGEVTGQDAMGNDIYDWLMKLDLEDLGLAFHVLIHDRYVRVFEVTTDIFVGLNINVLPDNRLEIALGELRIDDFVEEFNELLPNADFAEVLPTLLDLALGALLTQQLTFDLDITNAVSDALGGAPIYLRVNEIVRDGIQQDYLTMTLTFTDTASASLTVVADTQARLGKNSGLLERYENQTRPTGVLYLTVGEDYSALEQQYLEYQVRVDQGWWHVAQSARNDGTLAIADPRLMIPGEHQVEVRARYREDYQSLDPTPTTVMVLVDPFAPKVSARFDQFIELTIDDPETPSGQHIALYAKLDDGAWFGVDTPAMANGTITLSLDPTEFGAAERLFLKAVDTVGNESRELSFEIRSNALTAENADAGCACHESGLPHAHAEWSLALLALFAGALFLRARNRR